MMLRRPLCLLICSLFMGCNSDNETSTKATTETSKPAGSTVTSTVPTTPTQAEEVDSKGPSGDFDHDGVPNITDSDDDNDGVHDEDDAFPFDPEETLDTDKDGVGNNADPDDDNDGVQDGDDAFPFDPEETLDTDKDGVGNNADPDDDNDGVHDQDDAFPCDPTETLDTDKDGVGNNADTDDDNDGVYDVDDAFPFDPTESLDTDKDGVGNNADPDDDNDGVLDEDDAFPLDANEYLDTDEDGIGNNADLDDDDDGIRDKYDVFPTKKRGIKGYFSAYSVLANKAQKVYLSAVQKQSLTLVEFYDSNTDKLVYSQSFDSGEINAKPCESFEFAGCNFTSEFSVDTSSLQAGLYYGVFFTESFHSGKLYLNLKSKVPQSNVSVIHPSFTWAAYNNTGGRSLYHKNYQGGVNASKVSHFRPHKYAPAESPLLAASYHKFFADNGIEIRAYDDYDWHQSNAPFEQAELVILIGHSEYWSTPMRQRAEAFVKQGGKLLVASGNTLWWKTQVTVQNLIVDRLSETTTSGYWHKIDVPEEAFLGLSFNGAGYPVKRKFTSFSRLPAGSKMSEQDYNQSGGMKPLVLNHPIYAGLDLSTEAYFGADSEIVHIEMDGLPLLDDGTVDKSAFPQALKETQYLAWGWSTRSGTSVRRSAMIAESNFGKGSILHLGSIGWVNALPHKTSDEYKILLNAITYMMEK